MTTHEAFSQLISQPGWYKQIIIKGRPLSKQTAHNAKMRFLGKMDRNISIEAIEKYLEAAGYTVVSDKQWEK